MGFTECLISEFWGKPPAVNWSDSWMDLQHIRRWPRSKNKTPKRSALEEKPKFWVRLFTLLLPVASLINKENKIEIFVWFLGRFWDVWDEFFFESVSLLASLSVYIRTNTHLSEFCFFIRYSWFFRSASAPIWEERVVGGVGGMDDSYALLLSLPDGFVNQV